MTLWFDILSCGIAALSVVLCGWAMTKKGLPLQAQIVTALTGFVFVALAATLVIWRYQANRCDYETRGLCVIDASKHCPKEKVEGWLDFSDAFWAKHGAIVSPLKDKKLACVDVDLDKGAMSAFGRSIRGYTWGRVAVVSWSTKDPDITRRLALHEFGHFYLAALGHGWNEKAHHDEFKRIGWRW